MRITKIDYAATNAFSGLITDYLARDPKLRTFYHRFPELPAFAEQIREKQLDPAHREVLVGELKRQYACLEAIHPAVQQQLDLLASPKTYTVTTGHQLNIFTGPLYFIYKIVSTINLARRLKQAYPDYDFVPVYWMATEDHDFAEVNHFNLFGKPYTWETDQQGAVGRFQTDSMADLLGSLPEIDPLFREAYTRHRNLADATRDLVHALFGQYGLINLDGDSPALKSLFKPVILRELLNQETQALVHQTSEALARHYKPQVMAREINLFYLDAGVRERIVPEGEGFRVLNTDLYFSKAEVQSLVEQRPEMFSPNVILRPVYQEMVLPNLAYIGGGAEVTYWFQLKAVFAALGVPFPIVLLRNSALYIARANASRMQKLNLTESDVFQDLAALKKQITTRLGEETISLTREQEAIEAVFAQIGQLAAAIDPTLTKTVAAEAQKTQNALAVLEKKLVKASDTKYETLFTQLSNLKEKLFPGGTLQERVENLLTYQTNNPAFIQNLVEAFDPLEGKFTILTEE